ncbi:hypothetical protein D3C80_1825500 [compost metagenome]
MGQGESVGLTADFHHQAAHHRERQRHFEVKTTALACGLGQLDGATQLTHHVLHSIQADATPRDLGDLVAQAEARQEQERQQFGFTHLRHGFGR